MQVWTSGGWGRPSAMSQRRGVERMGDEQHQQVHRASVLRSDHIVLQDRQEQGSVCMLSINISLNV